MDSSDSLRDPKHALVPDPRSNYLVLLDDDAQVPRPISLADQHNAVAFFKLNAAVPEDVAIHFETAKNLYLYAWFVFRFYSVAEQQALTSLEFALRERLVDFITESKEKYPKAGPLGLAKLLSNARAEGLIRNEALNGREAWALETAKHRYRGEIFNEMTANGLLDEMVLDYSHIVSREADLQHDWLGDFVKAIPSIRNDYAHGSSTLHHTVLHTFDLVSQMINQLFPKEDLAKED